MPLRSSDRASVMFPHVGGGVIRGGGLCVPTNSLTDASDVTDDPANTPDPAWSIFGGALTLAEAIAEPGGVKYIQMPFQVAPYRAAIVVDFSAIAPVSFSELWIDCSDGGYDEPSLFLADGAPPAGSWDGGGVTPPYNRFRFAGGPTSATVFTIGWASAVGLHTAYRINQVAVWNCPPA